MVIVGFEGLHDHQLSRSRDRTVCDPDRFPEPDRRLQWLTCPSSVPEGIRCDCFPRWTAIGVDEQPIIGHVELQAEHATATWELVKRNDPGMAEQQHSTGIHRQSDGRVPELVARLDDGRSVALDGYRVEDGERVFRDTKGNHSFWYDSKNWSVEKIALKDRTEIQGTVDQVRRQVTAIDRLGGGRLEYIVTDERFARLLDDAVDCADIDWDVDVDIFYRPMERRRSPW